MMNLHRASTKPDWERINDAERTGTQRIAAATRGIVTPANTITAVGLVMVLYGLWQIVNEEVIVGVIVVALGRLLDIVDGWVAELTKTKSLLGEMCDAVADKIGTLLTVATLFVVNVAPWWVIVMLVLPQVIIPLIIAYKKRRNISVHPTRQGKLSMAFAWLGIVGLFVSMDDSGITPLGVATYAFVAISTLLGLYAAWQYARWGR